jgi:hypothetical protein
MAERGTYFDPNIGLSLQNYVENKPRFLGIGNYTADGLANMERAIPIGIEMFKRTLRVPGLKIVFGTDAGAGGHGRNVEEAIARVRDGGQTPMAAIVAMTSLAAESLRLQDRIGTIAPGMDADIVGLAGDPLTDITALRHVSFGEERKNIQERAMKRYSGYGSLCPRERQFVAASAVASMLWCAGAFTDGAESQAPDHPARRPRIGNGCWSRSCQPFRRLTPAEVEDCLCLQATNQSDCSSSAVAERTTVKSRYSE